MSKSLSSKLCGRGIRFGRQTGKVMNAVFGGDMLFNVMAAGGFIFGVGFMEGMLLFKGRANWMQYSRLCV